MNATEKGRAGALARWGHRTVAERFWAKVDKSGGPDACWLWTGSRNALGYGWASDANHRGVGAHRLAWILTNGNPGPLFVMHSCDNPPCVNPAHLSVGTHADNLRDSSRKGRMHQKITDGQVIELRERAAAGESAAALGRAFRLSYTGAKRIIRGRMRPHVGGPTRGPKAWPPDRGMGGEL